MTDVETFTRFYWEEQLKTAGLLLVLTTIGGLGGGIIFGIARPRSGASEHSGARTAEGSAGGAP